MTLVVAALSSAPVRAQNAAWAIWVMKSDGTQPRMVVQVDGCKAHTGPRWSHDGQRIAFAATPESRSASSVYIVDVDGRNLRRVGEHMRPDWSPDDKQLAFETYVPGDLPQITVRNLDSDVTTQIARGYAPRWSPDGSHLAVTDRTNARVIDLVSGDERMLLTRSPVDRMYYGNAWSPDGKQLAIVLRPDPRKHRQLLLVSADGEEQGLRLRLENEMSGTMSFSHDGGKLLFDNHYLVHIVDVAGDAKPVKVSGQIGASLDPDWSPDGEWIVFASSRPSK
ncbi:MAG: hypothetical protein AB7O59_05900 [Pirellulales bacterium]